MLYQNQDSGLEISGLWHMEHLIESHKNLDLLDSLNPQSQQKFLTAPTSRLSLFVQKMVQSLSPKIKNKPTLG